MPPKVGLDPNLLKSLTTARLGSLAKSKGDSKSRSWLPPPTEPREDYVCELTGIEVLKYDKDDTVFFCPVFRIADSDHHAADGSSLTGKQFSTSYWLREKTKSIATRALVALYGEEGCSDDWEVALDAGHLNALIGNHYMVRIQKNTKSQYPDNVWINGCLGKGEDAPSVPAHI
jgi:hypothetical protein